MDELNIIKQIVISALSDLLKYDKNIFSAKTKELEIKNSHTGVHDRKLHETAINHRFAIYLEKYFNNYLKNDNYYQVDIEYNRKNDTRKDFNGELIRPDIIIHKRLGEDLTKDNFIIVEAKKDNISKNDEKKVKDLMQDPTYNYRYGVTLTYCAINDTKILYKIFHKHNKKGTSLLGFIEGSLEKNNSLNKF